LITHIQCFGLPETHCLLQPLLCLFGRLGTRRQLEIALALALEPAVLMLDEPTAGMSPEETRAVLDLLAELPRETTVVLVEHDLELVFEFAERVVVLDYGRVVFDGTPAEARRSPVVHEIYVGGDAP